MELKDAILQTLAEIDEAVKIDMKMLEPSSEKGVQEEEEREEAPSYVEERSQNSYESVIASSHETLASEATFLVHAKDRLLVLFEGLNTPGLVQTEAKLDLTLNFLEYLLASIDERLEKLEV